MQPGFVLTCTEVDAVTGECTVQAWLPAPNLLPPMTIAEGSLMGGSFCFVFGMCWVLRKARQAVNV